MKTEAGEALLERGEMVHPDPDHPGIGVRMIAKATVREAVGKIEEEAAALERKRLAGILTRYTRKPSRWRRYLDYFTGMEEGWLEFNNAVCDLEERVEDRVRKDIDFGVRAINHTSVMDGKGLGEVHEPTREAVLAVIEAHHEGDAP